MERRTVPSFASFKPRPAANQTPAQKEAEEDSDRPSKRPRKDHESSREERHKSHRNRHSTSDHDRNRRHEGQTHRKDRDRSFRERRHEQPQHREPTPSPPHDELEDSEYFFVDRRGDSKNVEYGGLDRYSTPSHHTIGYGRVVGAERYARIDRDASDEKKVVLRFDRGKGGDRPERLLAKKGFKTESRSQRLILPQAEGERADPSAELDDDFLALRPASYRNRKSNSPTDEVHGVDYRSVEGKAKPSSKPQDEDLAYESEVDASSEPVADAHVRTRNAELSRAAKADPTNADAWLALVQYQARSTFPGLDDETLIESQRRSVADVRLSILDKAFSHTPEENDGHERLLLAYLEEGSKVWDARKIAAKWGEALKRNSASSRLWREYLTRVQTNQSIFRYETCQHTFLRCLEALKQGEGRDQSKSKQSIYVLLRLTRLIHDSGYDELALAIWQAVMEFHVFAPDRCASSKAKLASFDNFWESDVPRIGEDGALGWRTSTDNSSSPPRRTANISPPPLPPGRGPYQKFALGETIMATLLFFLPAAQASEDDESDDPFRYAMFSDVEPMLERLPDDVDEKLLIDGFLCFMGLPPLAQSTAHEWVSAPFFLDSRATAGCVNAIPQPCDSFSLFNDTFKANGLHEYACAFVINALSTLTAALPDYEELGEYLLAFLCTMDPPQAPKTARKLLKARPTSLRYYNSYALIQASTATSSDELRKAQNTWTKALELSQSLSEDGRDDAIFLSHSWMMTLSRLQAETMALQVLLTAVDGSVTAILDRQAVTTSGAVLKAKRHFEEGIDRMKLKRKSSHISIFTDCLAWLLYLTSEHDINVALRSFATTSTKLQNNDMPIALELVHQAKIRLISHHMQAKRPFKPALLRDELETSRRLFPDNSVILRQYYEVAKLTRLDDRLRNALSQADSDCPSKGRSTTSWLFEIDAEIERCSVDGGFATRDSVRALFRRALLQPDSRVGASALLWKRWFDLESAPLQGREASDGTQDESATRRTKEVFFDGLRFLPWSKSWVIDGMAFFAAQNIMGEDELQRIHNVLVDRELRVRIDVDALQSEA